MKPLMTLSQIATNTIQSIELDWYNKYSNLEKERLKIRDVMRYRVIESQIEYHENKKYITDDIDLSDLAPLVGMTPICLVQLLFLLSIRLHLNLSREILDITSPINYSAGIMMKIREFLPNLIFEFVNKPPHKCQIDCRRLETPTFRAEIM